MTTKTKMALTYLGGIITGIVLMLALCVVIASRQGNLGSSNSNVVLFEKPQQVIEVDDLEVIQVLPDGSALAMEKGLHGGNYGLVVALQAPEESSYYDDQKIIVPEGRQLWQIGTYRYMTRENMEKTVPIVEIK